ncbi:hypothetical protein JOD29_000322 [Lysinibacillus composti]|uniref:Uncharacterized protein n=1 Tax=Lysinibacillus composti TaxID=720633 RepID=A0A3N9UK73_9BACI|nr:hypothetical protein [Lysinibacillus composti]MBM7607085.1 hypothetical protein [Lysinibacillus composti]RQW76321.1 hypothetical protein EBB45_01880 [Lysinibacillus composti]
MRFLLFTILFFLVATVIKIDLTEGTVPLAAFSIEQKQCEDQYSLQKVTVQTTQGDTVQSLLAIYPSEVDISFPERLSYFYKLNPHLQNQSIVPGEYIEIPMFKKSSEICSN